MYTHAHACAHLVHFSEAARTQCCTFQQNYTLRWDGMVSARTRVSPFAYTEFRAYTHIEKSVSRPQPHTRMLYAISELKSHKNRHRLSVWADFIPTHAHFLHLSLLS